MTAFHHALNTGTLAAWLSVVGFGTVGELMPDPPPPPAAPPAVTATQWVEPVILLDDTTATSEPAATPPAPEPTAPEPLPAPPEMPQAVGLEPLPDLPNLPPPPPAATPASPTASAPRPSSPRTGTTHPPSTAGSTAGSAGGSGLSTAARIAAGRMPSPTYPAEARRKGQSGTVTVEFTVDTTGRVIAAFATAPSPWPLLNEEAVRTVRRWRFPPGGIMKLQRPIIFEFH